MRPVQQESETVAFRRPLASRHASFLRYGFTCKSCRRVYDSDFCSLKLLSMSSMDLNASRPKKKRNGGFPEAFSLETCLPS